MRLNFVTYLACRTFLPLGPLRSSLGKSFGNICKILSITTSPDDTKFGTDGHAWLRALFGQHFKWLTYEEIHLFNQSTSSLENDPGLMTSQSMLSGKLSANAQNDT